MSVTLLLAVEKVRKEARESFANTISGTDLIGCEVNIRPPNPGSHRFHKRLGFHQVGERHYDGGDKAVAYYVRPLD